MWLVIIKMVCYIIAVIIGFGLYLVILSAIMAIWDYIKDKQWKKWYRKGYDAAVEDITEYGWYTNKDNERIYIREGDIPTWSVTFRNGSFIGREK